MHCHFACAFVVCRACCPQSCQAFLFPLSGRGALIDPACYCGIALLHGPGLPEQSQSTSLFQHGPFSVAASGHQLEPHRDTHEGKVASHPPACCPIACLGPMVTTARLLLVVPRYPAQCAQCRRKAPASRAYQAHPHIPAEKVMQVAVDNAHIGIPPSFNHRDQGTVF